MSLKPATALAAAKPHVEPVLLAEIAFTVPSPLVLRVSDDNRAELGQEWLGLVQSWGAIEERLNPLTPGGAPATTEIAFFNTRAVAGRARLSDLIRSAHNTIGAWEFKGARVRVLRLDAGLALGDEEVLGEFSLEEPTEIDETVLRLRMSDASLLLEDQADLVTITPELFPNADPDDIGKTIPLAIGSLKKVRALAIVAGASTPLTAAVAIGATSLPVSDTSRFPTTFPFNVQIDDEVKACSNKTATTLTVAALATAHVKGATVWEARSGAKAYRFAVCENRGPHKTQSVPNVYANEVLQTSGVTVDLDETTLVAGRSFVVINFSALPFVRRQGNVDTVGVSATSPVHSSVSRFSNNTPMAPMNCGPGGNSQTATLPAAPSGTIVDVGRTLVFEITGVGGSGVWEIRRDSSTGPILSSGATGTPLFGVNAPYSWSSGTTYGSQVLYGKSDNGFNVRINTVREDVELEIAVDAVKSGTVALSGDSSAEVIFGTITCDVEGLQDDAAGSVSGLGFRQLVNPHDVVKLAMVQVFGVAPSALGDWRPARAQLHAAGYVWAGLIGADEGKRAKLSFSEFRRRVEEQSRCRLFVERGLWELLYLDDAPVPAQVLTYGRDVAEDVPARPLRTDRTRVFDAVIVNAQRDFSGAASRSTSGGYLYTKRVGAATGSETTLALDLVQDQRTADALATFWQRWWSRQRWQVDLVGHQNLLGLRMGDCFALDEHPILAVHGGIALVFRIVGKSYLLSDENPSRIRLTGIEATP